MDFSRKPSARTSEGYVRKLRLCKQATVRCYVKESHRLVGGLFPGGFTKVRGMQGRCLAVVTNGGGLEALAGSDVERLTVKVRKDEVSCELSLCKLLGLSRKTDKATVLEQALARRVGLVAKVRQKLAILCLAKVSQTSTQTGPGKLSGLTPALVQCVQRLVEATVSGVLVKESLMDLSPSDFGADVELGTARRSGAHQRMKKRAEKYGRYSLSEILNLTKKKKENHSKKSGIDGETKSDEPEVDPSIRELERLAYVKRMEQHARGVEEFRKATDNGADMNQRAFVSWARDPGVNYDPIVAKFGVKPPPLTEGKCNECLFAWNGKCRQCALKALRK